MPTKNYKLYILICPIDNMVRYVGVTKLSLSERLSSHISKNDNPYKDNWIKKLEKNNLKPIIKIAVNNLNKQQAFEMEIKLIDIYRGIVGKKLTNILNGGNSPPVIKSAVCQIDDNNQIINTFSSIKEAAKKIGVDRRSIIECCKGTKNTAGGYKWKYLNNNNIRSKNQYDKKNAKSVYQFRDNIKIAHYCSIREASRQTKIYRSSIAGCCKKRNKTAGGYSWEYADKILT